MICTVIDVDFTRGSPFAEQWWKLKEADGTQHYVAMCLNFNVTERWPNRGDTIEVEKAPPRKCYTGGGGYITCEPWFNLIKIVKRRDDVAA